MVQDLHTETYKVLIIEIKYLSKWKNITSSWISKTQHSKDNSS